MSKTVEITKTVRNLFGTLQDKLKQNIVNGARSKQINVSEPDLKVIMHVVDASVMDILSQVDKQLKKQVDAALTSTFEAGKSSATEVQVVDQKKSKKSS